MPQYGADCVRSNEILACPNSVEHSFRIHSETVLDIFVQNPNHIKQHSVLKPNRKKVKQTAVNLVKLKPNRKPQFFQNQTEN